MAANPKEQKQKQKPKPDLTKMPTAISVKVDEQTLVGAFREFSSGSSGYNVSGKIVIGGQAC